MESETMKKVLIVSSHFPPLNSMAAKRYGYMCKYMEENGFIPYVLTKRERGGGYLNSKLDLEIPIDEEYIYKVGDLGIEYPIKKPFYNMVVYKYKKCNVPSRIIDEESLGWYEKVKSDFDIKNVRNVDIIIGTFPSIENVLIAKYIAQKIHKPYIVEVRDLISDYEENNQRDNKWQRCEVYMEKKLLSKAVGIIAVTDGFSTILKHRYPFQKVRTVYNGWEENAERVESKAAEEYIYYAGGLYEHRVESLELLVDVIRENRLGIKLKIRSVGPEILEEKLKAYVALWDMQNQVEILKAAPEKIVLEEQNGAKINLIASSINASDKALMTTLPGKTFELIRLENPVLAIVDEKSEIAEILAETQKGVATSDKEVIASFIKTDYKRYEGYREEVNKYSRKNQAKELCCFLKNILEERI